MKSFLAHVLVFLISFSYAIMPVMAATNIIPSGGRDCAPGRLCNPLEFKSIKELIPAILDIVAQIGLVICTIFIIYAGFKYVTAQGNTTKISAAHDTLLYSVIGTAVLLGAKILASILSNTVDQLIDN